MFSGLGFLEAAGRSRFSRPGEESISVPCTERDWEDVKNDLRDDNIKDDWSNNIKDDWRDNIKNADLCKIRLDSSVADAGCVIKFASVEKMSFPKYVIFHGGKYVKIPPSETRYEGLAYNKAFKFLLKCKNQNQI